MTPSITLVESTLSAPWFLEMTHWRNTPTNSVDKLYRRSVAEIGYATLLPLASFEMALRVAGFSASYLIYISTSGANSDYAWEHLCTPLLDGIILNLFVATISGLSLGFNPFISTINPDEIRSYISFSGSSS